MPDKDVRTIQDAIFYQYAKVAFSLQDGRQTKQQCYGFIKKTFNKRGICLINLLNTIIGVIGAATFGLSSLLVTILFAGLAALILGIFGIWKAPSVKSKIGVLLCILVLGGCCSAAIIFLVKSNKEELQEALFQAAINGNGTKVKEMVAKGADINGTNNDGSTLLHNAIEAGNFPMFKALLEAGADIDGSRILQLVLERSHNPWLKRREFDYDAAVKLLLSHGAKFDFNAKDGHRRTCFQNAVENNQIEILKLMLDNGADINLQNDGGVLHWAIGHQAPIEIIALLMEHNPDVNTKNSTGDTPLHSAVYHLRKDVILVIVENGADVSIRNNRNMTALELARTLKKSHSGNYQEIIDLLEQKKDAVSNQDSNDLQRNKNEFK
ncbi:MAG: ankyrin repeat domain-containing protein [Planctomycetota bacterium]|nr:ankyrin repeat domain-containing protein [Planctomycetota bacterium]